MVAKQQRRHEQSKNLFRRALARSREGGSGAGGRVIAARDAARDAAQVRSNVGFVVGVGAFERSVATAARQIVSEI